MPTEDNSVTKKLLSPSSDKVHFENEMGTSSIQPEADLRLHDVVYDHEDVDEIQELLDENPDLVFEKDNEMRTPLHTLAISGTERNSALLFKVVEKRWFEILGVTITLIICRR